MKKWESHDYTRMINTYTRDSAMKVYTKVKLPFFGYSGKTFARWLLTWLVGLCMGGISYGIGHSAEALTEVRLQ
jgi:hypothetical protein